MMEKLSASSVFPPNIMAPRHICEIVKLEFGSVTYCINILFGVSVFEKTVEDYVVSSRVLIFEKQVSPLL